MRFSDLAIILVLILTGTVSGQSFEDVSAAAKSIYGKQCRVAKLSIKLKPKDVSGLNKDVAKHAWKKVSLYRVQSKGQPAGFCTVDNVKGKTRPITYLIAFDTAGVILSLEVLKYRESRGGEVQFRMFRQQFRDKSHRDPIRVGRDIRSVSGATISSRALARGARAMTGYLHWLKEKRNAELRRVDTE